MRIVVFSVLVLPLFFTFAHAVEPITNSGESVPTTVQTIPADQQGGVAKKTTPEIAPKKLTAEQLSRHKLSQENAIKALVKDQASRLQQLEKANLEALSQNQELQLKNDNLAVQVQVLQSERSAQMFLYGAATLAVGIFIGFLISAYFYGKRRRQW